MRDDLREPSEQNKDGVQTAGRESTYRSVAELAADLRLSERSTRSALRRGEIPHLRIGRRFILPKSAIGEWLRTAGRNLEVGQRAAALGEPAKPVASSGHGEVTVMRRSELAQRGQDK
jgi:excisionase family DNA binding protein